MATEFKTKDKTTGTKISVITPSYNRGNFLYRIFDSLKSQTNNSFEWIIVDDGSTDNTQEVICNLINRERNFPILSLLQNNGGKHRAINQALALANGEWSIFLDSDDWFTPTAIEEIIESTNEICNDETFCSVTALRVTPELNTIGTECHYDKWDTDFFYYRFLYKIKGDRAEIVKTRILKDNPFPEFENENFLAEGVLWNSLAEKYKTRFIDKKFYICEYQDGGLTDTFNKKMNQNPLGSMANQLSIINHKNCPVKYIFLANYNYYHYRRLAKKNKINIPDSLEDNGFMKFLSIFNPLIRVALKLKR